MAKLIFNKMRKRVLLSKYISVFALGMVSFSSFSQTTVTVGTATTTTDNAPVRAQSNFSYSQSLYMASDLIAGGATGPGLISKIRYYLGTGSNNANSNNWTVYLGNTNKVAFTTTTDWVPGSGLTNCFTGTVTFAANSWVEITLATPFQWNGVDNIVVAVDENATGTGGNTFWRYSDLGGANQRTIFYNNATTNPDPASPPTATSRGSWTPNIQFVWTSTPPCAGTPSHRTATVNDGSICPGQTVNFGMTGAIPVTGLSYEWEYNDGTSGWLAYPSSNAATFSTIPTETINVRVITTCDATGDEDISDDISVVMNPLPSLTVNSTNVAYCAGDNVQLIVADTSNLTNFTWLPVLGLNVANNDTVAASPANPTLYTATGTNSHGCTSTITTTVTPLSKATRTASYSPVSICEPGSPVTITAAVAPALINGGSTWEYRFVASDGSVLQAWNSSNTYNFIPAADSIYKIYSDFRSSTCPDAIDSIETVVVVGFGSDVSIINYDCNNLGGTVSLNNRFTQVTESVVYSNPLADAATDLTNVSLQGNASITGGRAVLTPSATGNNGSVIFNDPNFHAGTNNAMSLSFKMTADLPINVNGTGGADGLTYSFANDVANNGNQNGSGSKLRLVFDAASNNTNAPGIYLVYGHTGGITINQIIPVDAPTLFYSNNTSAWKNKTDVQVDFKIDVFGKASLIIDGLTIFSNIQMPPAYVNSNTATWKHAFSASTGGDALRHAISNLVVTAPISQVALVATNVAPTAWQTGTTFTNIQPGMYDVWMSSNSSTTCAKKIETIEILNTNPLVELGNDTTICEGESITLNAGNTGSTYVWSNSQLTTQTRTVTQTGLYVVNVTAANSCVGVGSINVSVTGAPTASTIYVQNNMPTYTFTILNPQNADEYSWDFGDGTTLTNAPGTVSHTYLTAGPRQVSVTLTNECGTETVVTTIVVTSTASVGENTIDGLNIYPNPATDLVTIALPNTMQATVKAFDLKGTLIQTIETSASQTELSVRDWNKGVYFLHVQNDTKLSIVKLVIQ